MNKKMNYLSGFLALQIIVALVLFVESLTSSSGHVTKRLLHFEKAQVNKMIIADGKFQLVIRYKEGRWYLPALSDFPASSKKIDLALQKLRALVTTLPVTSTGSSYERLEVSADNFQRRIQLFEGNSMIVEIFLGTSPGFKKTHVRAGSDHNVYALTLNTYDYPVKDSEWLDKELLAAKNIQSIKGKDFEVLKVEDDWKFWATATANVEDSRIHLDFDKVSNLNNALGSLRILGVAQKHPKFEQSEGVEVSVSGEDDWKYEFMEKDGHYFVRRDDIKTVFTLSKYEFEKTASISKKDLQSKYTTSDKCGQGE